MKYWNFTFREIKTSPEIDESATHVYFVYPALQYTKVHAIILREITVATLIKYHDEILTNRTILSRDEANKIIGDFFTIQYIYVRNMKTLYSKIDYSKLIFDFSREKKWLQKTFFLKNCKKM